MSERTKHCIRMFRISLISSLIASYGPALSFIVKEFVVIDSTGKKMVMGITFFAAVILTIAGAIIKHSLRTPLFLILVSFHYIGNHIFALLVCMTAGVMADEFVFTPLRRRYADLIRINKEIDKREAS